MNTILRPKLKQFGVLFIQTRGAQYNPFFLEPVFKPEELDTMIDDGRAKEMAFRRIKAAKSDHNTSVFRDALVAKFANVVMRNGNKELARRMIEQAFENIKYIQVEKYHKSMPEHRDSIECNPLTIFHVALSNVQPVLKLTEIKRGGTYYQVPVPITDHFSRFMAMRWLIEATKEKFRTIHFPERLATELLDAYKNEGRAVKRKQDLHKQCEANKAYAHYRWA